MTDTTQRQVRAVFANYKVKTATGVGLKTAPRGAFIDTASLADGEIERLERNGALMPQGREVDPDRLEETLARALNPMDVAPIDYGAPPDVAAPPLGAVPRGEHTTGDTGVDPADQPPPPVTGTVTLGQGTSEEMEALARLRSEGENAPRTDAPDVEDTAALSEFIRDERLNVSETVALAEGDPDRARYVLEAEKAATGQDPRKGVAEPLQKIIDQESAA
jgi:hypothetical protein